MSERARTGLVALGISVSLYATAAVLVFTLASPQRQASAAPAPTAKAQSIDDQIALDNLKEAKWQREKKVPGRERNLPIGQLGQALKSSKVSDGVRQMIVDFLVEYQRNDSDPAVQEYLAEALANAPRR